MRQLAAVAGAMVLSVAGGTALWQGHRQGNDVPVPTAAQHVPVDAELVSDQERYAEYQARGGWTGVAASRSAGNPGGTGSAAPPMTVYLVSSADQADTVRAGLDLRDEILVHQGQALPTDEILVVASAGGADHIRAGLEEANAIRAQLHLPPVQLVDLRSE
jgi:hypothetical protein